MYWGLFFDSMNVFPRYSLMTPKQISWMPPRKIVANAIVAKPSIGTPINIF